MDDYGYPRGDYEEESEVKQSHYSSTTVMLTPRNTYTQKLKPYILITSPLYKTVRHRIIVPAIHLHLMAMVNQNPMMTQMIHLFPKRIMKILTQIILNLQNQSITQGPIQVKESNGLVVLRYHINIKYGL